VNGALVLPGKRVIHTITDMLSKITVHVILGVSTIINANK